MKKALVIGGSGFSGRQVIQELRDQGVETYAIQHKALLPDNRDINVIQGGITAINAELIASIRPEYVFHLGRPKFSYLRKPGRILAGMVAASMNRRLIRTLENARPATRMVFGSGSLMYGSSSFPFNEDSPLNPVSYARQYCRGEVPVIDALRTGKLPVMIFRFPWLLGKGSWFEWFYLRTMKNFHFVPLFGNGDNLMEIIDLQDAVKLMHQIAAKNDKPGIYNLVSAGPVTQLEFASAVSRVSGLPAMDYRHAFPGRLESEALQAFTSSIALSTKHPQLFSAYHYNPLEKSLERIWSEYSRDSGLFENK